MTGPGSSDHKDDDTINADDGCDYHHYYQIISILVVMKTECSTLTLAILYIFFNTWLCGFYMDKMAILLANHMYSLTTTYHVMPQSNPGYWTHAK